jgi:hypothetical protein
MLVWINGPFGGVYEVLDLTLTAIPGSVIVPMTVVDGSDTPCN